MKSTLNIPLDNRPKKLQTERIDTCICCLVTRKSRSTDSSYFSQRAFALFPMLLVLKVSDCRG